MIAAALAAPLGACSSTTTTAKLKDPSRTALSFLRLGRSTLRPIEQGSADSEADLGRLEVETPGTIRRQALALRIECERCPGGTMTLMTEEGVTAATDASVSDLLGERKGRGKLKLAYLYAVSEQRNLNPVLETPRSNVDYFEETSTPVRMWGWALVPGVLLTGVGIWMLAEGEAGPGIGMMLPGLALDTFGVWQLVMSTKVGRYGPDGEPRPMGGIEPAAGKKGERTEIREESEEGPREEAPIEEPEEAAPAPVKEEPEPEPEPKAKKRSEEEPEKAAEPEEKAPEPEEKAAEPEKEEKPKKRAKKAEPKPQPKKEKGGEGLDDFLL